MQTYSAKDFQCKQDSIIENIVQTNKMVRIQQSEELDDDVVVLSHNYYSQLLDQLETQSTK